MIHAAAEMQRAAISAAPQISANLKLPDLNRSERSYDPECLQQPHDDDHDHNDIEYAPDLCVHRKVVVDEPQQDSDADQHKNNIDNWHRHFSAGFEGACGYARDLFAPVIRKAEGLV